MEAFNLQKVGPHVRVLQVVHSEFVGMFGACTRDARGQCRGCGESNGVAACARLECKCH